MTPDFLYWLRFNVNLNSMYAFEVCLVQIMWSVVLMSTLNLFTLDWCNTSPTIFFFSSLFWIHGYFKQEIQCLLRVEQGYLRMFRQVYFFTSWLLRSVPRELTPEKINRWFLSKNKCRAFTWGHWVGLHSLQLDLISS